jgi:hypothetical protein
MKAGGRPLRFLAVLLGGWVCVRGMTFAVPMWMTSDGQEAARSASMIERPSVVSPAGEATKAEERGTDLAPFVQADETAGLSRLAGTQFAERPSRVATPQPSGAMNGQDPGPATAPAHPEAVGEKAAAEVASPVSLIAPPASRASRWSAQAWMLWRPDASEGRALAPLLGGSQMGVRLDYRLAEGRAGALSLYGRGSRALEAPTAEEGAAGVAWTLPSLPLSVLVERRQGVGSGSRTGFAAMVAGGLNPVEVAPRIEAEAYAQAGIVGLPGRDVFADGKASLAYRLAPAVAGSRLMVGGAVAASTPPGARRIDVGPEVRLQMPAGSGGVRLAAEWRARVAGNARPSTGPVVTLISEF